LAQERGAWLLEVVGLLPEHARRYPISITMAGNAAGAAAQG